MEYTIIKAYNTLDLCKEVNKLISLGWNPIGGVGVSKQLLPLDGNRDKYMQAMVYKDFPNEN